MKKALIIIIAITLLASLCSLSGCGKDDGILTVGICQLSDHDALNDATQGFVDALAAEMENANVPVKIDTQIAGERNLCATVINAFKVKKVDLIMANSTPALVAAANATDTIPILGTSVTDYNSFFVDGIPKNVSGTSDAVPFGQQAAMMIDTLGLKPGDRVGVLYCSKESNSQIQFEAVRDQFEAESIIVRAYTFSKVKELHDLTVSMANECKAVYIPSDNTVAAKDTIVGDICTEKNIPIFTSYGGDICYASLSIDYYNLGVETGKMAAQILLGKKEPADFEIVTLSPSVTYNEGLCAKLGIQIPAN